MSIGIQVGSSEKTVASAEKSIMSILKTPVGDNVKIEALQALRNICKVDGAVVSGCIVNQSPKTRKIK